MKKYGTLSIGLLFFIGAAPLPYTEAHWEALLQMMHKNKEKALAIVEAIKSGKQDDVICSWQAPDDLDTFLDSIFFNQMAHDPQGLTYYGLFESIGIYDHNAHLNDISPAAHNRIVARARKHLEDLKKYEYTSLNTQQKISYKFMHGELEHTVEGERFLYHHYPVNQMFGVLFDLSILFTQMHALKTARDVEHYCARLEKVPVQIAQLQELLEHQKSSNIFPPRFALEKAIQIIERSLPANTQEHAFYTYSAPIAGERAIHIEKLLQEKVYPAYKALIAYCKELLTTIQTNHGVWALPNGEEYYRYALKKHTTTDLTADEIHTLGLDEVAKIQNEMRAILAQEGIVDEKRSIIDIVRELGQDPQFYYPETAQGKEQCLEDFRAILDRCRRELHPLFEVKPQSPVVIKAIPDHEAEGAPGAYYFPSSFDGVRPGMFFVNLRSMAEMPHYRMETLAIHEAEPGHHFQIAVQQETNLPLIRKLPKSEGYNAYIEGWALYTEKLAYEHDFYSSAWSKIGHLQDELMRAVRLVVDTGIHHKRWTREQAIEYMVRELGMHYDSVVTEVERYFVLPGQACSYKVGQLKLLELRKKMRDALGDKFDIREFHNVVLLLGAAPLTLLEEVIDEYIKTKKI